MSYHNAGRSDPSLAFAIAPDAIARAAPRLAGRPLQA
jgi:hypothetical protein